MTSTTAASRDDLVSWCDELLDAPAWADYCRNGMQVPGAAEVHVVASAVSCTRDVFERAAAAGATMLLVHHGLFWGSGVLAIDKALRERLRVLFDNGITLAAYHLPLDGHPTLGNNALLLEALHLEHVDMTFALAQRQPIGRVGDATSHPPIGALAARLEQVTGRPPLQLGAGPATVRRVAICSGGGGRYLEEAASLGADVLVTGEAEEPTHAAARELGMWVLAGGHYATETVGIRALGEAAAERFGVEHAFLHEHNPV